VDDPSETNNPPEEISKPAKIKKTILFKEKREGGLNLTNIKINAKSFKFQWICKLYNEDYNAFWKHLICARCSRLPSVL
jgi:hypothetical protein